MQMELCSWRFSIEGYRVLVGSKLFIYIEDRIGHRPIFSVIMNFVFGSNLMIRSPWNLCISWMMHHFRSWQLIKQPRHFGREHLFDSTFKNRTSISRKKINKSQYLVPRILEFVLGTWLLLFHETLIEKVTNRLMNIISTCSNVARFWNISYEFT